jgi:2-methylcitrate dehydratase PrpD
MNKNFTKSKETILAENYAEWALDKATALPNTADKTIARMTCDAVGLMYAARREDYILSAINSVMDKGDCCAVGHKIALGSYDSCLINGTAIHGEDFDDTYEGTPVHLAASLVPLMIALSSICRIDRNDWVRSISLAAELVCRLVVVAPTAIHRQGFHPTGVLGAFGAAAAAGICLQLQPKQLASALGIVGSMTSGIIEYLAEGTWTKRMHPGWAAASGLKAAGLAKNGFLGPRTVFEGEHGFFKAFADPSIKQDLSILRSWGESWHFDQLAFKPFACGTMAQPFIDCAITARSELEVDNIEAIVAHVGEGTVHRLWEPLEEKRRPSTPYGAKFSVPYCVAVGMVFGDAGLAQFTEQTLADHRVVELAHKVSYEVNPEDPYPREYVGWLEIRTKTGEVHHFKQPCMRGGKNQPMMDSDIKSKFIANCLYGGLNRAEALRAYESLELFFSNSDSDAENLFFNLPV